MLIAYILNKILNKILGFLLSDLLLYALFHYMLWIYLGLLFDTYYTFFVILLSVHLLFIMSRVPSREENPWSVHMVETRSQHAKEEE